MLKSMNTTVAAATELKLDSAGRDLLSAIIDDSRLGNGRARPNRSNRNRQREDSRRCSSTAEIQATTVDGRDGRTVRFTFKLRSVKFRSSAVRNSIAFKLPVGFSSSITFAAEKQEGVR